MTFTLIFIFIKEIDDRFLYRLLDMGEISFGKNTIKLTDGIVIITMYILPLSFRKINAFELIFLNSKFDL